MKTTIELEEKLNLKIDEKLKQAFEEGIRHSRDCHRLLQRAEERIEMILKNEHGEYEVVPMKETE